MTNTAPEPAQRMTPSDRQRALIEATKRVAKGQDDGRVANFLMSKGIGPDAADEALAKIRPHVAAEKAAFASSQRKRKIFPVIMIVFGICLAGLGLAVGRPQSILIGGACAVIGYINYAKVAGATFTTEVTSPPGL